MKKLKTGFTLVELMVFFMFISLLLAAATPIITKRIKDIPTRIYHGKYVCYRNSAGNLVEEYYNTTRIVASKEVAQCNFEPPKKAALYKIELVGAGAGGFQYIPTDINDLAWDSSEQKVITYDVKKGTMDPPKPTDLSAGGSSAFAYPTGQMIQGLLEGKTYRITTKTGAGGDGGDVTVTYVPALDVNIEHGDCDNSGGGGDDGFTPLDPAIKPQPGTKPCPEDCYRAWCRNEVATTSCYQCYVDRTVFDNLCPGHNKYYQ